MKVRNPHPADNKDGSAMQPAAVGGERTAATSAPKSGATTAAAMRR